MIPFPDIEAITEDTWDRVMAVNCRGPFLCARAAAPSLRGARGGVPPDVSAVVLSLLTVDAVTGETVIVDGGRAITY